MRVRQTANSRGQLPTLSGQHACAKQTANAGRVRAATDDVVRLSAIEMQREAAREFEAVSGSSNKFAHVRHGRHLNHVPIRNHAIKR